MRKDACDSGIVSVGGCRVRFRWWVASQGNRKDLKMKSEMKNEMIGAIVGDIDGARFEWHNRKCMG